MNIELMTMAQIAEHLGRRPIAYMLVWQEHVPEGTSQVIWNTDTDSTRMMLAEVSDFLSRSNS